MDGPMKVFAVLGFATFAAGLGVSCAAHNWAAAFADAGAMMWIVIAARMGRSAPR